MKKKTDKKMDVNYLDLIPVRTQGLQMAQGHQRPGDPGSRKYGSFQ